ncbi:MAG: hypothetical protein EOO27_00695 [Comamonadaceae bacterium]|nr:MAG: hypothetical protein EOO27_00695 [Comamonadaceae bacterium]
MWPPEAATWTEEALKAEAGLPAARVRSALQLLRQYGAVHRHSSGVLKWRGRALTAARAQALVAAECERREHEQQALERMTYYASSGLCRWSLLLDAFGRGEHTQRCDACDNCQRMAALDSVVYPPAQEEMPGGKRAPSLPQASPAPIDVRLTPGQPVRVPKYGRGRVVGEDAAGVQVEFADGTQRCFLRAFVQPVRARGGAAAGPRADRVLTGAAPAHPSGAIVVPGKPAP